jgi:hypothetical protein
VRLHDWPERFEDFIDEWRHKKFEWGKSDCIRFVDEAYHAQMGKHVFDDWFGTYTTEWGAFLNYNRQLKRSGHINIITAINSRLRAVDGLYPSRGAIIGRGDYGALIVTEIALGVALGDKVAFLGYDGLEFSPARPTDIFWCVE